jgi:endonuclease/exonuclease/phosphatase family metal-dependent hydrolase
VVVATYNVHRCIGTDGRRDIERVGAVIREMDADVVGLQEVETPLGSDADQLAQLARSSGLHTAVAGVLDGHPDAVCANALLCRSSPDHTAVLDLTVPRYEPRGALHVDLDVGGCRCRVVVTHLGLHARERRDQLRRLLQETDDARAATLTVILGDLNEWWRRVLPLFAHQGFGGEHVRTFPTFYPILALDHVLVRPAQAMEETHAHESPLARVASDHLPVRAVLEPLSGATEGTRR